VHSCQCGLDQASRLPGARMAKGLYACTAVNEVMTTWAVVQLLVMLLSMTRQMGMSMKGSGVSSVCVVTKAATQKKTQLAATT